MSRYGYLEVFQSVSWISKIKTCQVCMEVYITRRIKYCKSNNEYSDTEACANSVVPDQNQTSHVLYTVCTSNSILLLVDVSKYS